MAECLKCVNSMHTRFSSNDKRQGVTVAKAYIKTFDDAGNKNFIDLTAVLDKAAIDLMLYNPDESKRLHLVKDIKNNTPEITDKNFETDGSGQNYAVNGGGVRTVKFELYASEIYGKNISALACSDYSEFEIDSCGIIWGVLSNDGLSLEPRPIHGDSTDVKSIPATDSTVAKIGVSYQIKTYSDNLNNKGFAPTDVNINDLFSMELVTASFDTITTAGLNATVTGNFGLAGAENKIVGLAASNFKIAIKSSGVDVPITSVIPNATPNGNVYAIVTTAPMTAATVHTLTVFSNGFETVATDFLTP